MQAQLQGHTGLITLPAIGAKANGCTFAGTLTGKDGQPYALVKLDQHATKRLTWSDAMAWAKGLDADLPSRPESAMLFALLKDKFPRAWYWTNQEYNSSFAWYCHLTSGYQGINHKSAVGAAVAVRRFPLQFFIPFFSGEEVAL